ncbi:MAG: histidinol-phosphate transaminase [Ginsengibacter sp.]
MEEIQQIQEVIFLDIVEKLQDLKSKSGTHSPSIITILEEIPELKVKIDACFLSNPYATDLFLKYFNKELLETKEIQRVLEFYPSQNHVIAGLIGKHLNEDPDSIFVSNGAIEAIQAIIHRFVKGKVIVNIPTFSSYYEYVTSETQVVFYQLHKEDNYRLDPSDYIRFVKQEKPNTIILINPNNPDGGYTSYRNLKKIIFELQSLVENIIIDESFIHFAYENKKLELKSIVPLIRDIKNLTIIKSMSKDFGIAGIRCGYAIMQKERVENLLLNGYLWNINGLAEYFFRLYTRKDFLEKYEIVRKRYIRDSQLFILELAEIKNIKVYPTRANFVLIEVLNGQTAEEITNILLAKYGVYVRNCSDKIGLSGEFLRVAARTKEENNQLIKIFHEVFAL